MKILRTIRELIGAFRFLDKIDLALTEDDRDGELNDFSVKKSKLEKYEQNKS